MTLDIDQSEAHAIRYALTEMANRTQEQSINRRDPELARMAGEQRKLADRFKWRPEQVISQAVERMTL